MLVCLFVCVLLNLSVKVLVAEAAVACAEYRLHAAALQHCWTGFRVA